MATDNVGRQPIPPNKRRILQQCFEHATRSASKGDFDYATDMFSKCVLGDPANQLYAQSFLGNLYNKYGNNKKGSKLAGLRGAGSKGSLQKAKMSKDWSSVMSNGLEVLKLNPWDTGALTAMAEACKQMQCEEAELVYLKAAVDAVPADPEMNRLYGRALRERGMFDQAIAAWQRVLKAKPEDDEARRANANLQVERTIHKGGYEDAQSSTDLMVDKDAQSERLHGTIPISREQQLEKLIAKKPEEISTYLELADLHSREERFDQAEEILSRALQVSGGDVSIREKLEDAQLRGARQNLRIAEKNAQEEKTPETVNLYNKMRTELNNLELEVYRSRVERYPSQLSFRFELAVRLKRAGQFKEAIPKFQEAGADPKRKAQVHVELGECFQQIKQYPLAMSNYEAAIAAVAEREVDLRKLALYRAATLAMGLKDVEKAEKYLTQLASLDFAYRDVADRLEKIAAMRSETGGQEPLN